MGKQLLLWLCIISPNNKIIKPIISFSDCSEDVDWTIVNKNLFFYNFVCFIYLCTLQIASPIWEVINVLAFTYNLISFVSGFYNQILDWVSKRNINDEICKGKKIANQRIHNCIIKKGTFVSGKIFLSMIDKKFRISNCTLFHVCIFIYLFLSYFFFLF